MLNLIETNFEVLDSKFNHLGVVLEVTSKEFKYYRKPQTYSYKLLFGGWDLCTRLKLPKISDNGTIINANLHARKHYEQIKDYIQVINEFKTLIKDNI